MQTWLTTNWLALVSIIIGWVLAWYYYRRSIRFSRLSQTWEHVQVVTPAKTKDSLLRIQYDGHDVPRVTRSRLAIWNSGTDTIDGDHIVQNDPLRIQVPNDSLILRAELVRSTREAIGFVIGNIGSNELCLSFKFLDAKDGAVVELLHSGPPNDPPLIGTLKGLRTGVGKLDRDKWGRLIFRSFALLFVPIILGALGVMIWMGGIYAVYAWRSPWPKNIERLGTGFALVAFIIWSMWSQERPAKDTPHKISGVPNQLAEELDYKRLSEQSSAKDRVRDFIVGL